MDGGAPRTTELDRETAETLARSATRTAYYAHLSEYLAEALGEQVPQENVRAFEREDGGRVVAITDSADRDSLPRVGITFVFDEGDVTTAVAEVNDSDSTDGKKIVYPNEFAPDDDEFPEEIFGPGGESIRVEVRRFEDVTVHEVER